MTRKPSAILEYRLRIRESLRRQIEQAAKKRGVSLNHELTSRIERSFDQEHQHTIDQTAERLEASWAKYAQVVQPIIFHQLLRQTAEAVIARIEKLPAELQEDAAVKEFLAAAKRAAGPIDAKAVIVTDPRLQDKE